MPRPEEVMNKIFRGGFTKGDSIPEDPIRVVDLKDVHDFNSRRSNPRYGSERCSSTVEVRFVEKNKEFEKKKVFQ